MNAKNLAKLPWIEAMVAVLTLVFVAYVKASSYASEQQFKPVVEPAAQPWYMLGQYQPAKKPAVVISQ